MVTCCKHVC